MAIRAIVDQARHFTLAVLSLVALTTVPVSGLAQDYRTLLDLPPGVTLLRVSATVREEVKQDLLVAHLRFEARGRDARKLQDEINSKVQDGIRRAESYSEVKLATTQYNIYQTQVPPNRADLIWVGSQGVELKSKRAEQLLELTGVLQDMGFSMSSLTYTVSPELYDSTQDSLMEIALGKLRERAERAARALGKREADLAEIDVDAQFGGVGPQRFSGLMRSMETASADMAVSAPVAEAGETQITLTVSARALLKP